MEWLTAPLCLVAESERVCNPALLDGTSRPSSARLTSAWENYYADVSPAAANGGLGLQQHG